MTKIAKIKTLEQSDDFIKILKNKELLIFEDVQGSKIYVNFNGNDLKIKPKSLNSNILNFIDLTVQKFYNDAYNYFKNIPFYIRDIVNSNWWFCFEYFPDNQPANIQYKKIPKNNLILTCIVKRKNNYVYNVEELTEYSRLFDTDMLPIIFKGVLSNKQLEVLELYLNTNEKDLKYVFGEENFAYFFYKILNGNIDNSFLMLDNEFNDNLEKIIIKIDGKSKFSFEILNPLYKKMISDYDSSYIDNYSLILIKFLEFVQNVDLENIDILKLTKEELYIEYISTLFNMFINNNINLYNWNISIPQFFKDDKFKINKHFLSNKETVKLIEYDEKIEYLFKCILGSFNNKRKKPIGIFTTLTLDLYNNFIDILNKRINKALNINIEYNLKRSALKNHKDYFNIDYNVDSVGDIYPDVYSEFDVEKETQNNKKKKKKK